MLNVNNLFFVGIYTYKVNDNFVILNSKNLNFIMRLHENYATWLKYSCNILGNILHH